MNHWCLSIFFLLLFSSVSLAQNESSAQLKKRQAELRKDIDYKNKLLKQIKEDRKNSSTRVKIINKRINQREELILSIKSEIDLIDIQISENEDLIDALESDIEQLKSEYAKMVVQAYKTRNASDKIMYLFASENFEQAYRRMRYLQQLTNYRKQQAKAIMATQKSLESRREKLEKQREEKNRVLNDQNREKLTLNKEKQEKEKKLKSLGSQESQYRKELETANRKDEQLRKLIEKAIKREIAALNNSRGSNSKTFELTPEDLELGKNFTANKGKLPWPVDRGEITAKYGEQPHPFLKGIVVKKNGITISTTENNSARAVFDGEVSKVIILPGAGKAVMVRHGEYISVYTNLKETYVAVGDKVKTKEEIGVIITDKGKTETEFQLWKDSELINPSSWIYKAK